MTFRLIEGDCVEAMAAMDEASVDAIVTDLAAGIAGEHLVCADLLLAGYRAWRAEQVCPYDVVAEVAGRVVRIQVKTTRGPRAVPQRVGQYPAYMWHVRRSGKGSRRTYAPEEFDLLALIALDVRRIAYLPPSLRLQTIHIRQLDRSGDAPGRGGRSGKVFDDFPLSAALVEGGWLGP